MDAAMKTMGLVTSEMSRPQAALFAAVAQEMRVARGLLEELAAVLIADERFVAEYLDDQVEGLKLVQILGDEQRR